MPDAVALYLPDGVPSIAFLSSLPGISDAAISKGNDANPEQFTITFLSARITINVMPYNELSSHLQGFSNYVMSLHIKTKNEATLSVLERIAASTVVLGCVIEPGLDKDGYVGGLLTSIVKNYSGLMFAKDCVFDSDGALLIQPS